MNELVSSFWQGIFGVKEYDNLVIDVINSQMDIVKVNTSNNTNSDDNSNSNGSNNKSSGNYINIPVFKNVKFRQEMCLALSKRDVVAMEYCIDVLQSSSGSGSSSGGSGGNKSQPALTYSNINDNIIMLLKKSLSEIKTLQVRYKALSILINDSDDIDRIESYLLDSGLCFYSGNEVIELIHRRESLLKKKLSSQRITGNSKTATDNNTGNFRLQLVLAKKKALVTNLLIRRDVDGLKELLHYSGGSGGEGDDKTYTQEETVALLFLNRCDGVEILLRDAINSCNLQQIENTLSYACYVYGTYRCV